MTSTITIHEILAATKQIASIWGIEDVQSIRPDLSDDQAWEVLQTASREEDATIGINWDILEFHAEALFGEQPQTNTEDEP